MGTYPPPQPPPPGPPYGNDWKYQRRVVKEQARMQRDAYRAQRDAYRYHIRGLRRSSILGPLLLIAFGVIFLLVQTGHIESHHLWEWYSRFWPFLLVGAGVVMLLEWAFDQYMQSDPTQPRYRRGVGGGVFTLLLLLGLTGIILSAIRHGGSSKLFPGFNLNQDNLDEFMGDKHESDQSLSQAFPAGATLWVDNPRGDVTVTGTSDDNQIHVAVHKDVYTRTDSEADNKAEQLSPKLSMGDNNTLTLTVPSLGGARADLIITVPAATPASVMANHGDVHVNSIRGNITVTANHGDIDLSAITGNVTTHINNGESSFSAHSITGPISIEGHGNDLTLTDLSGPVNVTGDIYGSIHFEHIRGAIKFHTSRTDFQLARLDGEADISNDDLSTSQAVGPLTLSTRSRNITLDRVSGNISVTNTNGSVDVTSAPPLGNITVENRDGSVSVTVPEHAAFTVQADTTNGDLDNDFSFDSQGTDNHKTFTGTVGTGGPILRLTTSQGDLALKKAEVHPLPPMPPPPPPLSMHDEHGNNVVIGNGGVSVTTSEDGSSVIVGKNGMRLTTSADGTKVYTGNGTSFTSTPDGTKVLVAKDGTRITTTPDGTKVGIGPGGKPLSDTEIQNRLNQAEEEVNRAIAQHDAQGKSHPAK